MFVSIAPGTFLAYTTFDPNSEYEDIPENHTTVTYQLSAQEESKLLVVTQGDYATVPNSE
ncbi:hypothetical protein SAMN04487897_104215 [Paenibacillus sp. yr247]|uniref:hypothetical protein n=1 Tax=Paenibacillus sp. yr247 TaxID=1761880 RepID=UPI000886CF75|nr:hypothetical protein [Paenibacillus sp. yr247]SDN72776.1 hypothetical protein SAMN04487897_104215 [Paenibacillus sp. yr247]